MAPRLIDWNDFKPTIADALRRATGREVVISGDVDVSQVPNIEFRAQAVQLNDARGLPVTNFADVDAVIELWPLAGRTVVVERLIVRQPTLSLRIDETGRANNSRANATTNMARSRCPSPTSAWARYASRAAR